MIMPSNLRLSKVLPIFALAVVAFVYLASRDPALIWGPLSRGGSHSLNADFPLPLDPLPIRAQVLKHLLKERFPRTTDVFSQRGWNDAALDRLTACSSLGTCTEAELKVVILGTGHFAGHLAGYMAGEQVWAGSDMDAFSSLNYTQIVTMGYMESLLVYQHLPDLVRVIFMSGVNLERCILRNEDNYKQDDWDVASGLWQEGQKIGCIKKEGYLEGIPLWKIFVYHLWAGMLSPLGQRWTLSIADIDSWEPGHGNFYLGYSVEKKCMQLPFQPKRKHRAFILAKDPRMFTAELQFAWDGFFEGIAASMPEAEDPDSGKMVPFSFLSTAGPNKDQGGPVKIDQGGAALVNIGRLPQKEWWHELSLSKVMIGIGNPQLSPSPYDALCFGVPFINPIMHFDPENPDDRKHWGTQHEELRQYGPPYVYHVHKGDYEGLHKAIESAINNPIDRWIAPSMTTEAVRDRHEYLVENDWYADATRYWSEHFNGKTMPFVL